MLLLKDLYPTVTWEKYRRALCLLDPYGLDLRWEVMQAAGKLKTVEIFPNFPIMDMNRNVLLTDATRMSPDQISRMDAFWGDNSWRPIMYAQQEHLFGTEEVKIGTNDDIPAAFRERLKDKAGFAYVPEPVVMYRHSPKFPATHRDAGRMEMRPSSGGAGTTAPSYRRWTTKAPRTTRWPSTRTGGSRSSSSTWGPGPSTTNASGWSCCVA